MADDQSEWIKLPADEKCVHKQWKARVAGYEEAIKLFNSLDEKSPEFTKFLGVLKKICTDTNAIAQEKGLDAVLAFVENAHVAGRSCGEVMSALVTKCVNASRAKTKEKALEIILMYIEIDKQEIVQEELMKGLENKQPKVVFACVQAFRAALEQFGPKVISLKPLVKMMPKLLEDRDKTVREETKMLAVEVYRWIGAALKPQLANLKPVQLTELEAEFEKLPAGKPTQTRFMRSQQDLKAKAEAAAAAAADAGGDDGDEEEAGPAVEVDPLDLMDPVEILSKLPKNFYEQIEAKKWQERKEMLEAVETLVTKNPKLLPGEYGDLVRALKKVISKDTNVMLVALAARCLTGLANGLRKKFSAYAVQCSEAILVKFKEKKPMVVTALREAIDAIFVATSLDALTEDLLTALADKNPSVKAETAAFIARCFTKATTTTLSKKVLKPFLEPLSKTANDTSPEVREASFMALGTAMKVVSEKVMTALLGDIDPLKMTKIKECCEKAELVNMKVKSSAPKVAAQPKAAAKPAVKPAAKPGSAKPGGAKSAAAKTGSGKPGGAKKGKKAAAGAGGDSKPVEAMLSDEAVDEKATAFMGEENMNNLANSNWKIRLAAMEMVEQEIKRTPKEDMQTQAIVRIIGSKKPGLKDNNFQVLKLRLSSLAYLAENFNFSWTSAECIISDLVDKIGDVKNGQGCKDVLTAAAEATEFPKVAELVISTAFEGKNPKNQSESLNWLAQAIYDFGFKVNIKPLVGSIKKALAATNPAVRQSAITLLGVCYMYMGATLRVLFEDEKPALLAQIDAGFEKVKGQAPPAPTRGLKGAGDAGGDEEDADGDDEAPVEDLLPRNDISDKVSDGLLSKLSDKSWKIRKEGLEEVIAILTEAKFITANLGGLAEALKLRLADSNKILVNTTLGILKTVAVASGPNCKRHVPILAGPLLVTLGDSKPMVRQAATQTLEAWVEQTKLAPFVEAGVFGDSLRTENPNLRSTLLNWISPKLKEHQKKLPVELKECIPPLLACLNDRNPDVRKAAQEAILPFMMQTGFDSMLKAASKVDKSSKDAVVALLEKAKGELPSKPKKVQSVPVVQSHISSKDIDDIINDRDLQTEDTASKPAAKAVKGGSGKAAPGKKAAGVRGKSAPSTSRKKEAEVDTTPIMTNTCTKAQRMKDEKNLKVLKWNFTTPRAEFFEQLRDQMEKNFSASIMELLMHKDFQKHIKAIQMLSAALETHTTETLANIDLILKWFTLRFFETNPSMLNKALEYLLALFEVMQAQGQTLTNNEADAFIPYLIHKVGESKENVRKEVRKIFQSLSCVYPASKIFMFIMGGLASKNSKQRSECLEELGQMMERFGLNICQPSPKEALKEIAKQIADRDNSVRSAALNTIVVAHQILGDQVYKYVGRLNDKDLGMLEERIKRASRAKPVAVVPPEPSTSPSKTSGSRGRPSTAPSQSQAAPRASSNPPQPNRPSTAGTNQVRPTLPPEFTITTTWQPLPKEVVLNEIDQKMLDELTQPFPVPVLKTRTLTSTRGRNQQSHLLEQSPDAKSAVEMTVTNIASSNLQTASNSLSQLSYTMSEPQHKELLKSSTDQIIMMITLQLKQLHTRHFVEGLSPRDDNSIDEAFRLHAMCTTLLVEMAEKNLMIQTSVEVFKDFVHQAISGVLDPKLNDYPQGPVTISNLNTALGKVLLNGNATNTLCAPLSLLHDCAGPALQCTDSFTDLVQKCIWKITRNLSNRMVQLEMNPILKMCNAFFNDYPSAYWRGKESDKPLKTVKTVVATLVHMAPERVYTAISMATYSPKAELESYINRHMAKLNKSNTTAAGNNTTIGQSPGKLAQFIHNSLAAIFKKIGSRENSKEGIMELYQFREQYPDASLEPFLKKSSSFFQMYIQRGLQNIEDEKKKEAASAVSSGRSADNYQRDRVHGEVDWDEKLREHRDRMKRLGIGNISSSTGNLSQPVSRPPDVVLSTRTSNVMEDVLPRETTAQRAAPAASTPSHRELMDLKARLERVKKSAQS